MFFHVITFIVFSSLWITSTGKVPPALPSPLCPHIPKANRRLKIPWVSPPINSLFLPPFARLPACPLLAFPVRCPMELCSLLEGCPLGISQKQGKAEASSRTSLRPAVKPPAPQTGQARSRQAERRATHASDPAPSSSGGNPSRNRMMPSLICLRSFLVSALVFYVHVVIFSLEMFCVLEVTNLHYWRIIVSASVLCFIHCKPLL